MNPFRKTLSKMSPLTLEQHFAATLLEALALVYDFDDEFSTVPEFTGYASAESYVVGYVNGKFGRDNPSAKYITTMLAGVL